MLPDPFADALILTGPTGSGKTELGILLAQRLDAEIISMDSMAVYRHLDIGTAKPTPRQRELVRHHLVDVLDPWESASVAWWLREAAACCRDIAGRGKQVLLVGGTALYLKALLCGLFDGPPADARIRRRLLQEKDLLGPTSLHEQLARVDPATARRLHVNDTRRIVRALEVFELTGCPISSWQWQWRQDNQEGRQGDKETRRPGDRETPALVSRSPDLLVSPSADFHSSLTTHHSPPQILWLDGPRSVLYDRINRRVQDMFVSGLIEEARALRRLARPLGSEALQALGYKEAFAYLDGQVGRDETIVRIQTRTRNFAKRQITWFRHLPGCRSATAQLTQTLWQPRMNKSRQ
jgi:tRNA dimethylallyltransferase